MAVNDKTIEQFMNQNFKMTRGNRTSRERKSMEIAEPLEQNDSEDSVSVRNVENTNVKHGGIPLQKRWTSSEDSSRSHSPDIKTVRIKRIGDYTNFILYFLHPACIKTKSIHIYIDVINAINIRYNCKTVISLKLIIIYYDY